MRRPAAAGTVNAITTGEIEMALNRRSWLTAAALLVGRAGLDRVTGVNGVAGATVLTGLGTPARAEPGRTRPVPRHAPTLMLAREADPCVDPAGFRVSEKLDGVRAHWNGLESRFRSGLAVAAPRWFLARLPAQALDGELWLGRSRFEVLSGVVRRATALDTEWREVRYMLFHLPGAPGPFAARAERLAALAREAHCPALQALPQEWLADRAALRRRLADVVRGGGEGLMLHRADAAWCPGRSDALPKRKPLADGEAVVIGHLPGRGRHAGRMGALRVRREVGLEFLIGTGFSDAQRERPPPLGAIVTFSHRGRTAADVPRFASFVRERDPARS